MQASAWRVACLCSHADPAGERHGKPNDAAQTFRRILPCVWQPSCTALLYQERLAAVSRVKERGPLK